MKKFLNKKIGVFILSLLCGVLLSAAPVKSEDEAIIYAYKTGKNTKFEILFDKNKGYFAKFS